MGVSAVRGDFFAVPVPAIVMAAVTVTITEQGVFRPGGLGRCRSAALTCCSASDGLYLLGRGSALPWSKSCSTHRGRRLP